MIQIRNRGQSDPLRAYNFQTKANEACEVFNGELGYVPAVPFAPPLAATPLAAQPPAASFWTRVVDLVPPRPGRVRRAVERRANLQLERMRPQLGLLRVQPDDKAGRQGQGCRDDVPHGLCVRPS